MKKSIMLLLFIFVGLMISTKYVYADNEPFKKGYDYLVLPQSSTAKLPSSSNKVIVMEFYNFGCPSCYHFESAIENWEKQKPTYVEFYRVPVVFQPSWKLYAESYYIAQSMKVENKMGPLLFKAVQKDDRKFSTPEEMANFFQENGFDKKQFLALYNSPEINQQMTQAQKIVNDAMIYQVPTVMIDGTYRVDPSFTGADKKRFIDIINYLIQKQAKEKKII